MGTFPTADGYVNVAAMGDFAGFCSMIGAPELADDPRFADGPSRIEHRDALDAAVGEAFRARPTAEWVDLLAEVVPCGPVLRIDEVFSDPQVCHLDMTRTVVNPSGEEIEVLRPEVIVALGATAAQALFGKDVRVTRDHGRFLESRLAPHATVTVHPSSILRATTEEDRHEAMEGFVADLRLVAGVLKSA
jgi:crotonobetainyl-CoA:carnitine CoA-transferase CaiB-like acyl-CoA transferase